MIYVKTESGEARGYVMDIEKYMEKIQKISAPLLLLIFVLVIVAVISIGTLKQTREAEKDAKLILNHMDYMMEYTLPEGWEFKTESAIARRTGVPFFLKFFDGDICIGKENCDYDESSYGCIRISINKNGLPIEEEKEQLELVFGDSDERYSFERTIIIDGELAYCGTRTDVDARSKEIHMVHDQWHLSLYLTTEEELSEADVNALYRFAESIQFK